LKKNKKPYCGIYIEMVKRRIRELKLSKEFAERKINVLEKELEELNKKIERIEREKVDRGVIEKRLRSMEEKIRDEIDAILKLREKTKDVIKEAREMIKEQKNEFNSLLKQMRTDLKKLQEEILKPKWLEERKEEIITLVERKIRPFERTMDEIKDVTRLLSNNIEELQNNVMDMQRRIESRVKEQENKIREVEMKIEDAFKELLLELK
jgi:chromosome segregation ATPase